MQGIDIQRNCYVEDILLVARYFLSMESMTHKKLQKLCYYAQSWVLANFNRPLFPNRFEAWVHGPVSPDLYQRYKGWGWLEIPIIRDWEGTRFEDDNVNEILRKVFEMYGGYSGDELEDMTHEEAPWKLAREGCLPHEYSRNPISMKAMRNYYGARIGKDYSA